MIKKNGQLRADIDWEKANSKNAKGECKLECAF
jgi:hypothetical protein